MTDASVSKAIDAARVRIRYGEARDAAALNDLYNHYILNTPITFEVEPWNLERRLDWIDGFKSMGRYRLLVAVQDGAIVGFACSHRYHERAAYATTIETSIYCQPDASGKGIGTQLYSALFEALKGEPIHMAIAGVTLPNDASVAIHRRFGFQPIGVTHAVGHKLGQYWDVAWFEKAMEEEGRQQL
jgi:phosphinothricin acetyltransferase